MAIKDQYEMVLVVIFLFFAIGVASKSTLHDDDLIRVIESGPVAGFTFNRTDGVSINAWRGIPYASPPIGDLRWKASVPPAPWEYPLPCYEFRSECTQANGNGNEDCLYLNIYSSSKASANELLPVLFYIHGGGLMSGNGNYDMTAIVSKEEFHTNIIVVEINYRLNIFGFLATSELTLESGTSGNYGILDQQLALRWVKNNIIQFGGDPTRVTVMGQSSGGRIWRFYIAINEFSD